MNVITGLPRSGSTLLCNILNQNDKFHATTTSILSSILNEIVSCICNSPEFKYELDRNKEKTENRLRDSLHAFCEQWHGVHSEEIIFDKSRGWIHHIDFLQKVYPKSKIIILIRDLRNIFASVEKQNKKTSLLFDTNKPLEKTIYNIADKMFSPEGLIGHCITGIQDLFQRNRSALVITSVHDTDEIMKEINNFNVLFIKYEQVVNHPDLSMKIIYAFLEKEYFKHNFKDIQNTSKDPDGLYLHKFPHQGCGEITETDPNEWKKYMSQDIANLITERFEWYFKLFGYKTS